MNARDLLRKAHEIADPLECDKEQAGAQKIIALLQSAAYDESIQEPAGARVFNQQLHTFTGIIASEVTTEIPLHLVWPIRAAKLVLNHIGQMSVEDLDTLRRHMQASPFCIIEAPVPYSRD